MESIPQTSDAIEINQDQLLTLIKFTKLIYWIPKVGKWWYKLYMQRLSYRITEDCLICEGGVFFYRKKRVPYSVIREASIYRGPLLQLIGASIVRVQTSAQGTGWPEISYLCPADPEGLVEEIMRRALIARRERS